MSWLDEVVGLARIVPTKKKAQALVSPEQLLALAEVEKAARAAEATGRLCEHGVRIGVAEATDLQIALARVDELE